MRFWYLQDNQLPGIHNLECWNGTVYGTRAILCCRQCGRRILAKHNQELRCIFFCSFGSGSACRPVNPLLRFQTKFQILTSGPPKARPTKPIVTSKVFAELRPKREDYDVHAVKNHTWSALDRCWAFEPQLRPPISQVLRDLKYTFLPELEARDSAEL
jgi:hypothetical protein